MIEWITANWDTILIIISAVISIASIIVKLTPNETDNKVLATIIKLAESLGLNTHPVKSKNV